MINYFRYVFSEDELEDILNKRKNIFYEETFETTNGVEYKIKIDEKGFYVDIADIGEFYFYPYDAELIFIPMQSLEVTSKNFIYIYLDVYTNRKDKKQLYERKINHMLTEGTNLCYLMNLLLNISFNNNDEFIDLCSSYISFRLHHDNNIQINTLFNEKLEFYGFEEYDLKNKTAFNKSNNYDFIWVVNLALDTLYDCEPDKRLQLLNYLINNFKVIYLNYYGV